MLKIIANEIVARLVSFKNAHQLNTQIQKLKDTQKKLAHDIRGPIGGIVGLAKLIVEQGKNTSVEEILEINQMIADGGKSILDLADEILSKEQKEISITKLNQQFNLERFKEKLETLYSPQAKNKKINFKVISSKSSVNTFPKNKLLQITGNLISNAIKFTPEHGKVSVNLDLLADKNSQALEIIVKDTGVGMDENIINRIMKGDITSTIGTEGENGYGFGLALVRHLVEEMNGTIHVDSVAGNGAAFNVKLPGMN